MLRVGVAIPAHNVLRLIERCLTSLRAQTYPVDIYVVDDGSDDGTPEFLVDRPNWYTQLKLLPQRRGWPPTLNRAAEMAFRDHCDAVFLMNADDFLRLDCIERCVQAIDGHDWTVVYGQQIGEENVVQIPLRELPLRREDFYGWHCPLPNEGLIRREVWEAVGGYSTDVTMPNSFGFKEDWDFWLKVWEAGFTNGNVVREPVYYYVMHEGQLHREGLPRHAEARKLILDKHRV